MKNDWRQRKGLLLLLVVVAAAVWGINVYQIAGSLAGGKESYSVPNVPSHSRPPPAIPLSSLYTYAGGFRDPFEPPFAAPAEAGLDEPPESYYPEPYYRPEIGLTGIIGSLAMVRLPDGRVHFMSAGEEIDDLKLESVGPAEATFVHAGNTFTLKIN